MIKSALQINRGFAIKLSLRAMVLDNSLADLIVAHRIEFLSDLKRHELFCLALKNNPGANALRKILAIAALFILTHALSRISIELALKRVDFFACLVEILLELINRGERCSARTASCTSLVILFLFFFFFLVVAMLFLLLIIVSKLFSALFAAIGMLATNDATRVFIHFLFGIRMRLARSRGNFPSGSIFTAGTAAIWALLFHFDLRRYALLVDIDIFIVRSFCFHIFLQD